MAKKVETKEAPKKIKTDGIFEIWNINAYSGKKADGTLMLMGSGSCMCFLEREESMGQIRKAITLDHIKKLNRQIRTDKRNSLAVVSEGRALLKGLEALVLIVPEMAPMIEQLKGELKTGEVNPATLKAIESAVKTFQEGMKK